MTAKPYRAKPNETVDLQPCDYHWLYHLNKLSIKHAHFDKPNPTVPYLALLDSPHGMTVTIEAVTPDPPYYISPDTRLLHSSLLNKINHLIPDEKTVHTLPDPNDGVSNAVMQALLEALERHAIHMLPLQPDTKNDIAVCCDFWGWDGEHFEIENMYGLGIDHDAAYSITAVQAGTDNSNLYLHNHCLRHALLWIAYSLGIFYNPEWTPWNNDQRCLTVAWMQPSPEQWARTIQLTDEKPAA